ncbi:hypothetical protein IW261DRAFT_1299730, partial [Armillaria novae-zelandiae]
RHSRRGRCGCTNCCHARIEYGCASPHKCFLKAQRLLESLPPKWNPLVDPPTDVEIPPADEDDNEQDEQAKYFTPRLTTKGNLSEAFRIFVDGDECQD